MNAINQSLENRRRRRTKKKFTVVFNGKVLIGYDVSELGFSFVARHGDVSFFRGQVLTFKICYVEAGKIYDYILKTRVASMRAHHQNNKSNISHIYGVQIASGVIESQHIAFVNRCNPNSYCFEINDALLPVKANPVFSSSNEASLGDACLIDIAMLMRKQQKDAVNEDIDDATYRVKSLSITSEIMEMISFVSKERTKGAEV
jgi:hypothetical protein